MTDQGGSPSGRGPAGNHFEGRIGAYYLLAMIAGAEPRGFAGARIDAVRFQGVSEGFTLDDVVIHATLASTPALLEIQAKRTISFAPSDTVFQDLASQVAAASTPDGVDPLRHQLAVATARTSYRISGPYQDVLAWARTMESAGAFFRRLAMDGVSSAEMRAFVATFRANLIAAGIADEDETIWRLLRRFQILEFDFEASAPLAEQHALDRARQLLAPEDAGKARALWSALTELSIATAKTAGTLDRASVRARIAALGFSLAGDAQHAAARAKTDELAGHALADIEQRVASVHLPRTATVEAVEAARDCSRYVEVRGGPGVGKSAVLRHVADRSRREAAVLVLDPLRTPAGGWAQLALILGVTTTARDFLSDLACGGGAVLFIDSLEMFTDPAKRSTVNDLLREVAQIEGFSVIVTARDDFDRDEPNWLAPDARARLGEGAPVVIGELSDAEVAFLRAEAPELRALLADGHPAAQIARNLYRLARLLATQGSAPQLRTEADLAEHWWCTGDGADDAQRRDRQRLLADLADAAIAGEDGIAHRESATARTQLLGSRTLREPRRDWLAFQHDVLRDWAVAVRLDEDPALIDRLPLARPVPATLARGIEMVARLALEKRDDQGGTWQALLARLSPEGAHPSWRRRALLGLMRSEIAPALLEKLTDMLLTRGGDRFIELANAVAAVDTIPFQELLDAAARETGTPAQKVHFSLRVPTTLAVHHLLGWCIAHGDAIPRQATLAVLKLATLYLLNPMPSTARADAIAKLLYRWLMQLDADAEGDDLPVAQDAGFIPRAAHMRLVEDLREVVLSVASRLPEESARYLTAIAGQRGKEYKAKEIRRFSEALARAAPKELAALVEATLIEPKRDRETGGWRNRAFGHNDIDFMPPSPAQGPFYELLRHAPETGLGLVRRLASHAVAHYSGGRDPGDDGFAVPFEGGTRFFPWARSYLWPRGQSPDYALSSALMALEAWAHERIEAGEDIGQVLDDVLGPDGSCAAFLLVAVDLLLAHWPKTRAASVSFLACPELLSQERTRQSIDEIGGNNIQFRDEPVGKIKCEDLRKRPSRKMPLEMLLFEFGGRAQDADAQSLHAKLVEAEARLGDFNEDATFADPEFMAHHAMNVTDPTNWVDGPEGQRLFRPPNREASHLMRMQERSTASMQAANLEAGISLAIDDSARGSPELARDAAAHADGAVPDFADADDGKQRSSRLVATAMLVARDGDDTLLAEHEAWVRQTIDATLDVHSDWIDDSRDKLMFNPKGIAASALIHLWLRGRQREDLDRLLELVAADAPFAAAAVRASLDALIATDPRLPKAILRCALATRRTIWNRYDEDSDRLAALAATLTGERERAVAAELAWLEGGDEPAWPEFPPAQRYLKQRRRILIPGKVMSPEEFDAANTDTSGKNEATDTNDKDVEINSQAAAAWLVAIGGTPRTIVDLWLPDVIDAYRDWTAYANGVGLAPEAELNHEPDDWNHAYYAIAARSLLDRPESAFTSFVDALCGLPDDSFASNAAVLLFGVDLVFFNGAQRADDRGPRVRAAIAERTAAMGDWQRGRRPGELSVGRALGPVVAKLFLNHHNPFGPSTESYLVPSLFDRVDPMLDSLRPHLSGGPAAFVALCTMNLLLVAPRARHADFLLTAVETWLDKYGQDAALWLELGIGRRIITWVEAAGQEDSSLLGEGHAERVRIERVIGRLVAIGIPEAHALEVQMAAGASQTLNVRI